MVRWLTKEQSQVGLQSSISITLPVSVELTAFEVKNC